MQLERTQSPVRTLVLPVMLTVGPALGVAVPALAETQETSTIAACSADEVAPAEGSEWAVPPMPNRPGEPY